MTGLSKVSQLSNLFINKSRINTSIDSFAHALNKKKSKYFLSDKTISKLDKIANYKFGVEFKTTQRSGLMKVLFERPQNVDVKDYNVRVSKFISYLEDCKIPRFQTLTQSRLSQIIADGEAYLECGNGKREQAKAEGRDEDGVSISRADSRSVRTESRLSGRDDESLSNVKDDKQEQAHTQTQEKEQKQIDSLKKRINVSRDDLLSALRKKKDNVTQSDKTFTKIDKILERDFLISCKKIHKTLGGERVRLPRTRKDDEHDKNVSILIKNLDRYINISAESETTKDHLSKIKEKAQAYLDKVNNAIVARLITDEFLATHKREMLSENINGQNEPIYEDMNSQNKPLTEQEPETASNSSKIPLAPGYESIALAHIISAKQNLVDRLNRESE